MSSSSIIPNHRLDRDLYVVRDDLRSGAAFREINEGIDYLTMITDLFSGEYGQVLRVVAFNPNEGWSRDASEDIALGLERHVGRLHLTIAGRLKDFIEGQLGRIVGTQLPLTLLV